MVEAMERYLNLSEQGECIRRVLEIVPSGLPNNNPEAPRRFRQTLDPGEIDDLAEAYKAGTSIKDLADRFGIDRSAILKKLQGLDIPRRYPALDPEQCEEVCRLYEGGLNSSEIGQVFDVSADTVLRILRRASVVIRYRA
jgi:DNA-directed RNA polymerase specialized sigma24 family protein